MRLFGKHIYLIVISLLSALLLSGCTETLELSTQKVKANIEELSAVVEPGDLEVLNGCTMLRFADFSGSRCYEDILAWAEAHPEVDVRYTVALPDGQEADSHAETLDLSSLPAELAAETASLLRFLPALKTADLGCDAGSLPLEALALFAETRPDINYLYNFTLGGTSRSLDAKTLELSGLTAADADRFVLALPFMRALEAVELGSDTETPELSLNDISKLQALRPDVCFKYRFRLFGKEFSTTDTEMDLNHIRMYDGGAAVREALSCMPELNYLDMDSCGVSNEDMAAIRDDFPGVDVVWRVWFGDNYSVRTDVEKILASKPTKGGSLTASNTQSLKYCTRVKYLDVGHNPLLDDISFVSYMPDLEVAILAMGCWSDTKPLAACTKLEYLEIQTTNLNDLTPLAELTNLRHLNIGYLFTLTDISPLYGLTRLERLWIGCLDPVPAEQVEIMQQNAPDCVINTTTFDPCDGGWRFIGVNEETGAPIRAPRYDLLIDQFGYTRQEYSFSWLDPKY